MIERLCVGRPENELGELLPLPLLQEHLDLAGDVRDAVFTLRHIMRPV
jgi:hypothetical protein